VRRIYYWVPDMTSVNKILNDMHSIGDSFFYVFTSDEEEYKNKCSIFREKEAALSSGKGAVAGSVVGFMAALLVYFSSLQSLLVIAGVAVLILSIAMNTGLGTVLVDKINNYFLCATGKQVKGERFLLAVDGVFAELERIKDIMNTTHPEATFAGDKGKA